MLCESRFSWVKEVEVSVFPNGLSIGCNENCPESEADITIFKKRLNLQRLFIYEDEKNKIASNERAL